MDGLSPETRALLDRSRGGDALPAARRRAIRASLAVALGLSLPLTVRAAVASPRVASWLVRAFGAFGVAGAVAVAALAGRPASFRSESPVTSVVAPPGPEHRSPPESMAPDLPSAPVATTEGSVVQPNPTSPEPPKPPRPVARTQANPPARSASVPGDPQRPATSDPPEDDLAAEARIVAKARAAYANGHTDETLAALSEHDRRFPAGALSPESGVLRAAALCASGRVGEARATAKDVGERFPSARGALRKVTPCAGP
ncbi:MAG: hypothetical protein FWD17_16575 [Polyangiaceae bacterium]|nr:hypothetical protein [Polyangiaceae bacterium]